MVTGPLVDRYVDAGRRFVSYLDAEGVEAPTALWLFRNDRDSWKLILAVPQAENELRQAVHRVLEVFRRHEAALAPLRSDDIAVKSPSDRLMRALRERVQDASTAAEVRVTGSPVGGVWVEDALLYRAQ
jgi:hypothetical protein